MASGSRAAGRARGRGRRSRSRPPGRSTRNASARTRTLRGDRLTTPLLMTASTDESGDRQRLYRALRGSARWHDRLPMRPRPSPIDHVGQEVDADDDPDGPTRRARAGNRCPPPEPRSTHVLTCSEVGVPDRVADAERHSDGLVGEAVEVLRRSRTARRRGGGRFDGGVRRPDDGADCLLDSRSSPSMLDLRPRRFLRSGPGRPPAAGRSCRGARAVSGRTATVRDDLAQVRG